MSEDEYLALDRQSEWRWEYVAGEAFELGGARPEHNLVVANVGRALGVALADRPCVVLASQQKIATRATGAFHYPDVVVVCGALERDRRAAEVVCNPTLIVEVLSPTTADYDRGAKFEHYVTIPSLAEVLLISTGPRVVQRRRRQPTGEWALSWHHDGAVELTSVGATLSLEDVYDELDLTSDGAAPG